MITTGILGGSWRATIDGGGGLRPVDGRAVNWFVAAEDRWHIPSNEPSTRQRRIDGTPVTETRVRIPGGDAVQRIWTTADGGGTTWIEVHNGSPRSIAVAFDRADLLVPRPPADVPIAGLDLGDDAVSFPVGHAASTTVGVAHDGSRGVRVPATSAEAVVRGWATTVARASTMISDPAVDEAVVAARCDLLLAGFDQDSFESDEAWLVAIGEMARMGQPLPDALDIATAVQRQLRRAGRPWQSWAGLDGAARALSALDERRAVGDLRRAVGAERRPDPPVARPDGVFVIPWAERRLVGEGGVVLPDGWAPFELGVPLEAHGLECGGSTVSLAIRWHGARPAVLWEVAGQPLTLTAPRVAPGWQATTERGEALWPAPADVAPFDV